MHDALRAAPGRSGARASGPTCGPAAPGATDAELLAALWDLVWAGEVTNDSLAPVRAYVGGGAAKRGGGGPVGRRPLARPRPGRLTRLGPPPGPGRWSLVAPLLEPRPTATEAAHATALQLLERHGVLTREAVLAEGVEGGFAGVYGVLKVLEERGQVRRGYFVAGLGAAQFALPGAVDRLRAAAGRRRRPEAERRWSWRPPTRPSPTAPRWPGPSRRRRPAGPGRRRARRARPAARLVAWLDRRGHHLVTFPAAAEDGDAGSTPSSTLVKDGRVRSLEVRKIDGGPAGESPLAGPLRAAGFVDGYRGLVLRQLTRVPPRVLRRPS